MVGLAVCLLDYYHRASGQWDIEARGQLWARGRSGGAITRLTGGWGRRGALGTENRKVARLTQNFQLRSKEKG